MNWFGVSGKGDGDLREVWEVRYDIWKFFDFVWVFFVWEDINGIVS